MAKLAVQTINPKHRTLVRRETSHVRQSARRVGINIPKVNPTLPVAEQEETDIG
jgi:hypothetical protein